MRSDLTDRAPSGPAVLEALVDAAAQVDGRGVVLAVNRAWREGRAPPLPRPEVGSSYQTACATAGPDARRFAIGLDRVLVGHSDSFSMECSSHEGEPREFQLTARAVPGGGAVVMQTDVTPRHRLESDLAHRATHDTLTGLANRSLVIERIEDALGKREQFAVLFCDLDRFKVINDTLGHDVGDEVLRSVATRLTEACDRFATVGRLGGDEFAVVITGTHAETVDTLAEQIVATMRTPLSINGRAITASISIGHAARRDDHVHAADILRDADAALYDAKQQGRGRSQQFSAEHARRIRVRAEIERDLQVAFDHDELVMHYQPIVDLRRGTTVGVEALMRWNRPGHGLVAPMTFIPVAEEIGLIALLDRFALFTACRDLARFHRESPDAPQMVSVNVSGRDFSDPGMVDTVRAAIAAAGIAPQSLCIEITESTALSHSDLVIESLHEIRSMGCYLAIDDFGTGYSSLAAIRTLPVEVVKIDRSFVSGIAANEHDAAVISAVMSLAHALGMHVIAEGVETEAQARALVDLGCHAMQGYLFGRPVPAPDTDDRWPIASNAAPGWLHPSRITDATGEPLFIQEFMHQMGIPIGGAPCAP